jgi:hypothetical protein
MQNEPSGIAGSSYSLTLMMEEVYSSETLSDIPPHMCRIPEISALLLWQLPHPLQAREPSSYINSCPQFLTTDPEVPGSIPGASEWVYNEVHPASQGKEKVAAPVYKPEINGRRNR